MNQPTVCALMLTADRPALAKRAVECFRAQTYERKRLLILDTASTIQTPGLVIDTNNERVAWRQLGQRSIGELRNRAILEDQALYGLPSYIICHWDDDDWSHPNRIAEQVALMESTGADVCGYTQMLFWRSPEIVSPEQSKSDLALTVDRGTGETWHWTGPTILGTSLCYRRAVWERFPFPDTSYGEDTEFLKRIQHARLKIAAVSSVPVLTGEPRMIARIHSRNTSKAYSSEAMKSAPHHWSRQPEWDQKLREVMES